MSFTTDSFARGAFKRLNSLAHTGNHRDPSNESILSAAFVAASKAVGMAIAANPTTAVSDGTVELVTLDLTVITGSNNLAYEAKFQSGYSGHFGASAQGDLLRDWSFGIPKAWSSSYYLDVDSGGWIPILKAGATTIAESDAADWYFDPVSGIVVAETAFGSTPTTIKTYIYIGDTIQDALDALGGGTSLPVDDTTSIVRDPTWTSRQMRIDVGNVQDSMVRTLTMPNQDVDLTPNSGTFPAALHASRHQSGGADAIKLDDLSSPDDNTDLNATTSAHGLVVKATAPASTYINVVGIANGETAYTCKTLYDATNPAALGTAAPGSSVYAARRDHVHTLPKLDDAAAPDDNTDLNATTTSHGLLLKATAPAATYLNVVGIANGETSYTCKTLFDATNPAGLGTAAPGSSTYVARRDHVHAMPALDTLAATTDITTLDATTSAHGLLLKATAPASGLLNVVGIGNGETSYANKGIFDNTNPAALGTAGPGTQLVAARRDHVHTLPKLDDCASPDDNTDLNATTTSHGLLLKATAPASTYLNVVGIANGETAYTCKTLFDATNPAALGTASPGTSVYVARRDHVHTLPKLDDAAAPDDNTDLNATTSAHGLLLKATAPTYANYMSVVGIAYGETAYSCKLLDHTFITAANETDTLGGSVYPATASGSAGGIRIATEAGDPSGSIRFSVDTRSLPALTGASGSTVDPVNDRLLITDTSSAWPDSDKQVAPINVPFKRNLSGTAAPTANEDAGDGYDVGSLWVDTTNDKSYICVDSTVGAAVWNDLTASGVAGAPTTASYLTLGLDGGLSAERVLTAGAGIGFTDTGANGTLTVATTPDGTTIENNLTIFRVKALGIGTGQLANSGVTPTKLSAAAKTVSRIIYIENPVATDDFPICYIPDAVTIVAVRAQTSPASTTMKFNLYERAQTAPFSGGTAVDTTDFTADDDGMEQTTGFENSALAAETWLYYSGKTGGTGTPTKLIVQVEYTID